MLQLLLRESVSTTYVPSFTSTHTDRNLSEPSVEAAVQSVHFTSKLRTSTTVAEITSKYPIGNTGCCQADRDERTGCCPACAKRKPSFCSKKKIEIFSCLNNFAMLAGSQDKSRQQPDVLRIRGTCFMQHRKEQNRALRSS